MSRLRSACYVTLLTAMVASAQMPEDYLDVFLVKVKPERRADFDAVSRKIAEANRKAKGDTWVAAEAIYGEVNVLQFISQRQNYAAVESGMGAFAKAIQEAYGPGGMKTMEAEFNSTVASGRSEIRRRRWDLSINVPKDSAALDKHVSEARWRRTMRVQVHRGEETAYEELLKQVKTAYEQNSPAWTVLVSQTVVGEPATVYYITTLRPTLASYDSAPELRKTIGEEAYARLMKVSGEATISTETTIWKFVPAFSNPPAAVMNAGPEFWSAKPAASLAPAPTRPARAN